ncbi:GNAT family N-acetyltransferase [uncultured Thalassospira sp.]|uniref:GNAT family N-acetyltransferase n=1 Tax=uncultured Thalassospira sp. TaxID=404382 RepID=UPI0030DA0CBF|tara:strand:+ start:5266 stop:5793 length:528 start_codon:yes stop_codon:yes gene_type:complete
MLLITTPRLILRQATREDAEFILKLLNQPDWIHYIGDRNIGDLASAAVYINERLIAAYERNGFGLYPVDLRATGETIGLCGLVKRDTLPDPDIGFAFLDKWQGQGFAREAANATLNHAYNDLGISRVVGFTLPGNNRSIHLLESIGMVFDRTVFVDGDHQACNLYVPANQHHPAP